MKSDRRTILSLVALGRITPAEAERLLAVWNEGREELWVMMACVAAILTQSTFFRPLERLAHLWMPDNISALHHALTVLNLLSGGIL